MNRNLWLLAACQGLFLTNNVAFIAINGLVGLALAPRGWMATLPVMGYVVGAALATGVVARAQQRFGRRSSFQLGLGVALASTLLCALAAFWQDFWLLCAATLVAGYYAANASLYRFAASELAAPEWREKAVSLVMAGGLLGAVAGPNLAAWTRNWFTVPFAGAYLALAGVAVLSMLFMRHIAFAAPPPRRGAAGGRSLAQIARQPEFLVAAIAGALSFGVMNLLMAATPLAMQICSLPFEDIALVLEWHVIGMFAPGFFTGHLIRRFGTLPVMGVGLRLDARMHCDRAVGRGPASLRAGAVPARRRLEPAVHGQHHLVAHVLFRRGEGPRPGRAQLLHLRDAGPELVRLGPAGHDPGLAAVEPRLAAAGDGHRRRAALAGLASPRPQRSRPEPRYPAQAAFARAAGSAAMTSATAAVSFLA